MSEEETEVKDSNELLNIILILLGLFYIFLAVLDFLAWAGIPLALPAWVTASDASQEIQGLLGSQGLVTIALGVFAVVAGIGMFKEEEWALGIALVVLVIIVINSVSELLGFITTSEWWLNWINYISIGALVIGVLGFLWLVFTTERYK
ncbi:MAG: hypothetical protein GF317_10820 [Candidatus Lokiarchaeota archaeon]|nr:hypothetical protein [Candidatus Lokiarchaeota archaeon]MBD3200154.1 hypothetical protein [Candidatus Lokiarchaeota archaeon]